MTMSTRAANPTTAKTVALSIVGLSLGPLPLRAEKLGCISPSPARYRAQRCPFASLPRKRELKLEEKYRFNI
ncbi:hypothetical protein BOTBODRAFT_255386 [Botryobasidium botryosum FD-172 SS1]|uniref:Uncharacterized protein n=1 Tax=Botryobasidium botryosum (strain FD-172 SS1) TaxID=930990 RepID=A0A067LTG8_BOTB1|nr:hypothetical protein BOTBODRAFT_255386 [Botryobasidium botryosum FD-172 SS1]